MMRITVIIMSQFSTLCIAWQDFNHHTVYNWKHQLSFKKKRILRIFTSLIIQYQLSLCGSLSLVYYKFSEAPILLFETEDTENVFIADYPEPVMNKWFVITAK